MTPGLEQVAPRAHDRRQPARRRSRRGRRRRRAARLDRALLRRRRPHRLEQRRRFRRGQRLLHARRGRLDRPPGRGRRAATRFVAATRAIRRPARHPRHRPAAGDDRADDRATLRGKFLRAVHEAGAIYRRVAARQGRGRLRHRGLDGRNRPAANARRTALHPRGGGRRGHSRRRRSPRDSPAGSTRASTTSATSAQFAREFEEDLAVIALAVREFGLPENLKLSVHSRQRQVLDLRPDAPGSRGSSTPGVHLKTAGTTWLEELIGLAMAGGDGLDIAKDVYRGALRPVRRALRPVRLGDRHRPPALPSADAVARWDEEAFASACVTTRRARPTTPICGSSFTSATRSPPRWARATSTPWINTPTSSASSSPRTPADTTHLSRCFRRVKLAMRDDHLRT